jgi:hypothetical protein
MSYRNPNNLQVPQYSTELFHYDAASKVLSVDMSQLSHGRGKPLLAVYGRLYGDACDIGIELVSHRTRECARFALREQKADSDSDIMHWDFYPTTETLRAQPQLEGHVVRVFND